MAAEARFSASDRLGVSSTEQHPTPEPVLDKAFDVALAAVAEFVRNPEARGGGAIGKASTIVEFFNRAGLLGGVVDGVDTPPEPT